MWAPLFVLALLGLFACGSSSKSGGSTSSSGSASGSEASGSDRAGTQLEMFAAASLKTVLPQLEPGAKYTFGGSGALATQIEQGAPADVFAAASAKQPAALFQKGLVERPVRFATNTLVLIVPRSNPGHIASVQDVTRPGVKLVICNATVPCGDYARTAFKNLGITQAALRNVASQSTDVSQTVAQVAAGQADAGFVYVTDAKAAAGKVSVIRLPPQAKPRTLDAIAVVKASHQQSQARAFVTRLLSAQGQAALRAAGFGPP